jgi:hypothetical protein
MDQRECLTLYKSKDKAHRCEFLVHTSFSMTVAARGTYEADTRKLLEPEKLRGFNEIQHQILSKLRAILTGDQDSYRDDVSWQIVYAKAEVWGLLSDLSWSTEQAIGPLRPE